MIYTQSTILCITILMKQKEFGRYLLRKKTIQNFSYTKKLIIRLTLLAISSLRKMKTQYLLYE